ncbi:hypothetical protein [Paracoccus kondratievae]|uniref:hypothetical protein n=1 Tax=Paracoccus kondratievae TaxID=135740 RepID=UPI00187A5696|nr:hypothetical protein [Paracoccus kondratievae]
MNFIVPTPANNDTASDAEIHARALSIVDSVIDSDAACLVLRHASAMLLATLAYSQPDPETALEELLAVQAEAATGILQDALALASSPHPSKGN